MIPSRPRRGGGRSILAQCIPLDTPYTIIVCPIHACNFRCRYCTYSLPKEKQPYISKTKEMDLELYKKMIDDMKAFPHKVKVLNFCGSGEPLLNPKLPEMIKYAVDAEVANTTEVISNGTLLTKDIADALSDSGLTRLKISIQGLNADTYKEFSQVKVDFEKIVAQIKYFYEHRKNTKLYIKIMDAQLKDKTEQDFFDIFGDICDDISIEHLVLSNNDLDFIKKTKNDFSTTINGNTVKNYRVCPRPFFVMNIHSDGDVDPCCSSNLPGIMGNVGEESIVDIWNGKIFNALRRLLLEDKNKNAVCRSCEVYKQVMFEEDNLDEVADSVIEKFV